MGLSLAILCIALLVVFSLWGTAFGARFGLSSSGNLNQVQDLFFRTVFMLLGYVAKRDGPVNKKEIKRTEVYMEKMALSPDQKREAIRLFKEGSNAGFDADTVIKDFYGLAKKSPNLVQILLVYLINLARVDGSLSDKETDAVQKVAFGLGYSSVMFQHLLQMVSSQYSFNEGFKRQHSQTDKLQEKCQSQPEDKKSGDQSGSQSGSQSSSEPSKKSAGLQDGEGCAEKTRDFNTRDDQLDDAYEVLGVTPDASEQDLKKAYRSLINQYHPDKLMGQGLPSYMIQSATECFQTVQSAYEYIKDARAK